MTFTTPTTKEEMYQTLQQIFHYYRIEKDDYEETVLEELNLERMEFTALSDSALNTKAQILLAGKQRKENLEAINSIDQEIAKLNSKISSLSLEKENAVNEILELYSKSEEQVEMQAIKNGLINSSIVVEKIASLETEKNNKISEINTLYADKISSCQAEIEKLNEKSAQVTSYFSAIHTSEISAKVLELKEEQEETQRTVFKYNNSLEEKELKYRNSLKKSSMELKLKYMDINAGEITKDKLVDMGYYDDVISCVCGYYDGLTPLSAYQDIVEEQRIIVFLDDYYQNIVYMYKLRAGA